MRHIRYIAAGWPHRQPYSTQNGDRPKAGVNLSALEAEQQRLAARLRDIQGHYCKEAEPVIAALVETEKELERRDLLGWREEHHRRRLEMGDLAPPLAELEPEPPLDPRAEVRAAKLATLRDAIRSPEEGAGG